MTRKYTKRTDEKEVHFPRKKLIGHFRYSGRLGYINMKHQQVNNAKLKELSPVWCL